MGRIERILGALAAFLTIATGGFLIYDRFRSENAAKQELAQAAAAPAATPAPVTAAPASTAQPAAASAAPKETLAATASAAPKPKAQLVFLCEGQQSVSVSGKNPVLDRFKNAPPEAKAIFDFSSAKQAGTGEVLVRGQSAEWSAYQVAVQVAGQRTLYGATGKNVQGLTFTERGEVNLETSEWTSTRVIHAAAQRGPQAEIKIAGKCSALDSPKPKPSDAPPQWEIDAKSIPG